MSYYDMVPQHHQIDCQNLANLSIDKHMILRQYMVETIFKVFTCLTVVKAT